MTSPRAWLDDEAARHRADDDHDTAGWSPYRDLADIDIDLQQVQVSIDELLDQLEALRVEQRSLRDEMVEAIEALGQLSTTATNE